MLREGIGTLLGGPLRAETANCLDHLLGILPVRASIFAAGLMLARSSSDVRLSIKNLSSSDIADLLNKTRGRAIRESAEAVMASVQPCGLGSLGLSIDVGPEVGPNIGIECYAGSGPEEPEAWRPLLTMLVEGGLCRPTLGDGLMSMPPAVRVSGLPPPWGDGHPLSGFASRNPELAIRLHHVKIVVNETGVAQAKAYIGVTR